MQEKDNCNYFPGLRYQRAADLPLRRWFGNEKSRDESAVDAVELFFNGLFVVIGFACESSTTLFRFQTIF